MKEQHEKLSAAICLILDKAKADMLEILMKEKNEPMTMVGVVAAELKHNRLKMTQKNKRGVLWRLSDGRLIAVDDVKGPRSLYVRQFEMSNAGYTDTACASLEYIKESGFDVDRFVDPEESEYRKKARPKLRGDS